jgi:CO/xanthine dehydrogenase FAD-binding subunit
LAEALELRARHPTAVVVGGATRVFSSVARPAALLDLSATGLAGMDADAGGLRLGAMTPVAALLDLAQPWGALRDAAEAFRPSLVRAQATVGGNVSVGGSLWVPLVLGQAEVTLASTRGERRLPMAGLQLADDELLVAVHLPRPTGDRSGYGSIRRVVLGPALTSVAMATSPAGWQLAVRAGGLAVQRFGPWSSGELAALLTTEVQAQDDVSASARYRSAMAVVLAERLARRLANYETL